MHTSITRPARVIEAEHAASYFCPLYGRRNSSSAARGTRTRPFGPSRTGAELAGGDVAADCHLVEAELGRGLFHVEQLAYGCRHKLCDTTYPAGRARKTIRG